MVMERDPVGNQFHKGPYWLSHDNGLKASPEARGAAPRVPEGRAPWAGPQHLVLLVLGPVRELEPEGVCA